MKKQPSMRIRAGAVALFASGVFTVVGLYLRGPILDPALHTEAFVRAALSMLHVAAWSILLPSLVIQMYGFYGLYLFMAPTPAERTAFRGLLISIASNGFFLPFVGIIAFTAPAIASLYLQGNAAVIGIFRAGIGGAFAAPFMSGSAVLLFLGSLFFGIAIWRSGVLPRWTAVPYVLHSLGIGVLAPFSYALEYTGALMLLLSTAVISWTMWNKTA